MIFGAGEKLEEIRLKEDKRRETPENTNQKNLTDPLPYLSWLSNEWSQIKSRLKRSYLDYDFDGYDQGQIICQQLVQDLSQNGHNWIRIISRLVSALL